MPAGAFPLSSKSFDFPDEEEDADEEVDADDREPVRGVVEDRRAFVCLYLDGGHRSDLPPSTAFV